MSHPKDDPRRLRAVFVDAEPIDRDALPLLEGALEALRGACSRFHARRGPSVPPRSIAFLERRLRRVLKLQVPDLADVAARALEDMRLGTAISDLFLVVAGSHVSISEDILSVDALGTFRISRPFEGEGLTIVEIMLRPYAVRPPSVGVVIVLRRSFDLARDDAMAGLVRSSSDGLG